MNSDKDDNNVTIFTFQWLIVELLFWGMLYKLFFVDILRPYIFKMFSNAKCFNDVKMRSGTLMKNMADEVPFSITIGIHHVFGYVCCF